MTKKKKKKDGKEREGGTSHISAALYVRIVEHTEGAPQAGVRGLDRP